MRAALAVLFVLAMIVGTTCVARAASLSCVFQAGSPGSMVFGNYDTISGASVTATATIQFSCDKAASVTMTADGGLNGTVGARSMKDPVSGDLLPYTISLSASHAPIFGDGTGGTQIYSNAAVPKSTVITVTVYGIINGAIAGGAGDVHAGSYSDTVTITITF